MSKVKITQIKSINSATKRQAANLVSLGIRRMHHSAEHELTPNIQGMIEKVKHLVKVEEISK
ncbi:MAG: 50S ribosomal protein L30 [Bacteroidales bacterium]